MKNRKPLHIGMVLDVYEQVYNGGVLSTKRFVERLRERNHRVTVVAEGKSGKDKIGLDNFYPPFSKNYLETFDYSFAIPDRKILKEAFSQMDVVHIHFPLWLGISSVKIAKEMNVPIVTTFHMQAENILYNIGIESSYVIKWLYQFLINQFYNPSDHVIFPSEFAKNELIDYGLTTLGTVISNGITDEYHPKNVSRISKYQDKFIILMVGRLTHEKKQDVLIQAALQSKHKNKIQLIFIGKGANKERLIQLGRDLPNPPEFYYLKPEEVIDYYHLADLYVHTSEIEVEGMATLEAIACGLPAIISNSNKSAAKQFALDERFLFHQADPVDLAQKIDYLIENNLELVSSKDKYLEIAKQYHIDKSVDKLEEVYYQVVN